MAAEWAELPAEDPAAEKPGADEVMHASVRAAFGMRKGQSTQFEEDDMVRAGQILSDMHYQIQDDLRKFVEHLNPCLKDKFDFHSWNTPIHHVFWHALLGWVLPAVLPWIFARSVMDWPTGFKYEPDSDEVVSMNLFVDDGLVKMRHRNLHLQLFLANGWNSVLIVPAFFVVKMAMGCVIFLSYRGGECARSAHHSANFRMRGHVEDQLSNLRLVSNMIYSTAVDSYFALILTLSILAVTTGGLIQIASGVVLGYVTGQVYLRIVDAAAGQVGGRNAEAMIAAYAGTKAAGHAGLWERVDNWSAAVFPATSEELESIIRHPGIAQWSEHLLAEKISNPKIPGVATMKDAKAFTYGKHRVIRQVWLLDQNRMLDLVPTGYPS